MFPFVKKKEVTLKSHGDDATPSNKSASKQTVSQEEIKHLEETKYRLFGAFSGKKREKSPSPQKQQLFNSTSKNESQRNGVSPRPTPPAKPPRLTAAPSEDSDIFHPLKTFNIPGLNLPALHNSSENERVLAFSRQPNGDYPFSLRRALAIDRLSDGTIAQRTVVLLENARKPNSVVHDDERSGNTPSSTLTSGDQLLAVNDQPVGSLSREAIVDVIRRFSGDEIKLRVRQLDSNKDRIVTFKRQHNGEFGFLLRRAQVGDLRSDGTEQRRQIVLAEPVQQIPDFFLFNGNTNSTTSHQLVAVNGHSIEHLSRDELLDIINRSSEDTIQLTVKPAPPLIAGSPQSATAPSNMVNCSGDNADIGGDDVLTVCDRSPSCVSNGVAKMKNEIGQRVWLVHRDGYAAALLIDSRSSDSASGKLRIRLLDVPGEVVIDVDAVDVEKANPANLDRVDDLANQLYLNETSVLHLLRQRHASSLIHTYGGSVCTLITNPQHPLSIYSDKVVQMMKGCRRMDMPPHIYAVAHQMYRSMIANRRSQAVLFTGRTRSGKTIQLKHFLHYLCLAAGSVNKLLTTDKIAAIFNILEAFGHCRTSVNSNASRFITFLTLDFDHVGEISSGLLQCLLLEFNRVVRRPAKETNFHVFSYLWKGCDSTVKEELLLNDLEEPIGLLGHCDSSEETEYYRNQWSKLSTSLEAIGVSVEERQVINTVLAAIFQLSAAGATKGIPSFKSTFLKPMYAQKAARLLGVSLEELQKKIFISTSQQQDHEQYQSKETLDQTPPNSSGGIANRMAMGRRRVTPFRTGGLLAEKLSITDRPGDGVEALEAFLIGLYRETFSLIISLINRSLASNYRTVTSITLIDYPGYQVGPDGKGGFNEFCFNYINERLNAFYHNTVFENQMETYRQEKIEVDFRVPSMSPTVLVDLIDKPMQNHMVKSTNLEARSQEKRGILWLLDEESIFPGATDESFIERIFVHYSENNYAKYLMKSRSHQKHFVLRHAFGTFPVTYNSSGWLRLAQENPVTRQALPLLQESNKSSMSSLFLTIRSGGIPGGQNVGFMDNASLRRTTAVYKTLTAPQAMKRKSYCAMVKLQMDYLVENLRRCGRVYFVHCLDPTTPMGNDNASKNNASGQITGNSSVVDVPYLRSQLRSLQITDTVRFDKSGYPDRMLFSEFRRRFECLTPQSTKSNGESKIALLLDDRESVGRMLKETFEADQSQAVLGVNYVFMKSSFLAKLEDQRDQQLTSIIILFQAQCRSYSAKQRLKKRRIQDTAIRCIQKNIDKYLVVRSWPWWRLYTRVLPLLSVQKTEEDIKAQQEELESLRVKYKKLEKQYSELRLHCDRLEARLEESRSEACDERSTASQITEALEEENKMRIRAEKELAELKSAHSTAEKRLQKLEHEAMEQKKVQMLVPAGGAADEDELNGLPLEAIKEKMKEARVQLETERKRHDVEKKEDADQQHRVKQKLEKKLSELQKELEEVRDQSTSQYRLAEKNRDEAHDLRVHIQQLTARNADLEKRQRKFDTELQSAKGEKDLERSHKERLLREHQTTSSECLRMEAELRKTKEELSDYQTKYEHLVADYRVINEARGQDGKETEQQLRLQKQNLERKCIDQEAELDDLSGELHQLQQRITRLEMQNEKLRQESAKEAERKEEEFDELRAQNQRRIRMLEEQIEDERHHKEHASRKVKELELRLREAEDAPESARENQTELISIRRQLKKVKALWKDSQLLIEQHERNAATKGAMKQLKNQLEDANAMRLAAIKSRQKLETELEEMRGALASAEDARTAAEDRCIQLVKERSGLENRLADVEQEVQDLLKKYKAQVQQASVDHITLNDQIQRIHDLEKENDVLKDRVNELSSQLERKDASSVDKHKIYLAETKIRQLESKLELEAAGKARADAVSVKVKEQLDSLRDQLQNLQAAKERGEDMLKRIQNQYGQQQDALAAAQRREAELAQRQRDLEASVERLEEENVRSVADLKLALRRIDDLQAALREEVDTDKIPEDDDIDLDAYSSEEDEVLGGNGSVEGRSATRLSSRPDSGSSAY